ncbi:MAG TPA: T9SS type A sorting domain-containing protein [Hymenobacter sp.]|jgi:hypothetical protein|uniref:T9SS type A sorting domain-containing protein n=1 Tax=Hymenobacter sp. TaxID=1898978 RepID=UPI002EDA9DE4
MHTNTLKLFGLMLFAGLAPRAEAVAQAGQFRREDRPARREMRDYVQANVLPVVRQQRQKLEAQLAPADRAQLATYRTQLQTVRANGKALRQSLHPAGTSKAPRPTLTEAQREQLQQLHAERRSILLKVAEMARKYDAPIQQLAQEVQPQKEKWAADMHAIVTKNATSEQRESLAQARGHRQGHHGLRRFFRPATFLLMNTTAASAPAGPPEREVGSASFYPNPATATSNLEYEVKKAGPVTVDLLDKNGNKLRTLVAESQQEKGPHKQQIDLHDLPAGTYFYKITTNSGSETKRFIKE